MTIAAAVIGLVIVAYVGVQQLSGTSSATLKDPAIRYPTSIQDHAALGSTSAPLTLDVYGDFQCPFCARSALDVEPVLVSSYVVPGKLRIVHHEVQWIDHTESRTAMAGAYCAAQQGKFWPYSLWVYNNQAGESRGGFALDRLTAIATAAGVDTAAFTPCIGAAATLTIVDAESVAGLTKVNGGTPTFYLNGTFVRPGSLGDWTKVIDAALASPSATAGASSSAAPGASAPASAAP